MTLDIEHLDFEAKHVVSTFGWPGWKTTFGARCDVCGEAWALKNREYALKRLELFREELCPGRKEK